MKHLITIFLVAGNISLAAAQTASPAPPFYPTGVNAVTASAISNNGTPMVKNPVENNNPSVQASIPINNKPVPLETDVPQNSTPPVARIINENAQANTPVKNRTVAAIQGKPGTTTGTVIPNIPSDSLQSALTTFPAAATTASSSSVSKSTTVLTKTSPAAETTVLYSATTGVDAVNKSTVTKPSKSNGNTVPVRQTYIAENVVNKFKSIYGDKLYDIRLIRSANNKYIYVVRTQSDGIYTSFYLNEEGTVIQ